MNHMDIETQVAENSAADAIVAEETEVIENETAVEGDDESGDVEETLEVAESQETVEEDATLDWGDSDTDIPVSSEYANQDVLNFVAGDAKAKAAYESQLLGFEKFHKKTAEFQDTVNEIFSGTSVSKSNGLLADLGANVRVLSVESPELLVQSVRSLMAELSEVDSSFADAIPVDLLEEVDPRLTATERRMAELERRDKERDEQVRANAWKSQTGNKMAELFEKQTGKKVDVDLIYKVHKAGHRPKTISELTNAIGRVDFDAYLRLQAQPTGTKKQAPASATAKTSSGGGVSSIKDVNSDPSAWLKSVTK